MSDGTKGKAKEKPKKALTWAEKLAQLPDEEAAALRAKAAEASRRSKARKRGMTPEQAAVARVEARLAKADEQLAQLQRKRTELAAELKQVRAALKAAEKAQAENAEAIDGDA